MRSAFRIIPPAMGTRPGRMTILHVHNNATGLTFCGRVAVWEWSGDHRERPVCKTCRRALDARRR